MQNALCRFKKQRIAEFENMFIRSFACWHNTNIGYNMGYVGILTVILKEVNTLTRIFKPFYKSIQREEYLI